MIEDQAERITIYRIAREAGVSPATVSRVLNRTQPVSPEKRRRVEDLIRQYNFRPSAIARSLNGQNTRVLGFIQPDISHPYFNSLFLAAEQHALELGYTIILGNTLNDNMRHFNNMETHYMRLMEEKHVDGVLIAGGRIHDVESAQDYMDEFRRFLAGTPVVTVSGRLRWIECPSVSVDEQIGISLMVNYLVSLRHERIGFLGGVRGIEPTETRLIAFRSALADHGLTYREAWHLESGFLIEDGRSAMESLMQLRDKPSAVVCFNDLVAIGALFAARKSGLAVPRDISIAGIDNIPFGRYVYPPITTVDLRGPEQARIAVKKLIGTLTGIAQPLHTLIEPQLAIRESCAPPT